MAVEFGIALPNCTEGLCYPTGFTSPEIVIRLAREAERLGFDSVWGNDHFSTQAYVKQRWSDPPNYYEPLITLTAVAAATKRVRVGTCVLVTPLREVVLMAKQAATLDVFSQGRLILGVGVGAYREEFEAVFPGRKGNRGEIHEEALQALRVLFRDRVANFEGRHQRFAGVEAFPKPIQDPLPIWTSGNTRVAAERAGRYCDGWMPAVMPVDRVAELVDVLRQSADAAGRDASQIAVAPQIALAIADRHDDAVRTFRESWLYHHFLSLSQSTFKEQDLSHIEAENLVGTPEEIAEKLEELIAAGCTYFPSLILSTSSVDATVEQMQAFAETVMSRFSSAGTPASLESFG